MWNAYVVTILCLYAPSHKFRSGANRQMMEHLLVQSEGGEPTDADPPAPSQPVETINLEPSQGLSFFTKTAQE